MVECNLKITKNSINQNQVVKIMVYPPMALIFIKTLELLSEIASAKVLCSDTVLNDNNEIAFYY